MEQVEEFLLVKGMFLMLQVYFELRMSAPA